MAPVVPGYVPFALLVAFEAVALVVWVTFFVRQRRNRTGDLLLCTHCTQLHARGERVARVADALAVGALAFLVALPFVAASYESGFTLGGVLLTVSAVVAVLAVAAETDFFARLIAGHILRQFTWDADIARVIGGGARWFGVVLAAYLFQHPDLPGHGIAGLFGGVGAALASDLPSIAAIYVAAAILLVAAIGALAARWLVPFALNSSPTAFAAPHVPHKRAL